MDCHKVNTACFLSTLQQAQARCMVVLWSSSCAPVISLVCEISTETRLPGKIRVFPSQEFSHPHTLAVLCLSVCCCLHDVAELQPGQIMDVKGRGQFSDCTCWVNLLKLTVSVIFDNIMQSYKWYERQKMRTRERDFCWLIKYNGKETKGNSKKKISRRWFNVFCDA